MPSCAQRLTVFGDTWRSSATCAVRRYLGSIGWATRSPILTVAPPGLGRPYACRGRMPSSVLHRLIILRCVPVRLGSQPTSCMDVDQSSLLALELCEPPPAVASGQVTGLPRHRLAARQARMPSCDKQWPQRLWCARQRFTFCLATRRSSLFPLPSAPASGRASVDTSKTLEGGQEHDGWNREMVQR
jgi:hypothetical protein